MTIQLRIKLSDEIKNLLNDDIYKGAIERYVTVSQSDNEAFEAELAEVKLSYRQRRVRDWRVLVKSKAKEQGE
jgi:hypothetical protein